jgi:hypothetical protein
LERYPGYTLGSLLAESDELLELTAIADAGRRKEVA